MAKFLNKDKSFAEIVEIVSKADNKLVLISPYIKIPDDLLERLKYKDGKGIKTIVVCREKDLHTEEKSKLRQLKCLELRFDEDLHAKCFYNEKAMVITSLNLLDYSRQHNREMGILLSSDEDPDTFNEALREATYIVEGAKEDSRIRGIVSGIVKEAKMVVASPAATDARKAKTSSRAKTPSRTKQEGHCIRCNKSIPYDFDTPYCPACYRLWKRWKNPNHEEKFCHRCGKEWNTTIDYPLCLTCFRKSRR